MKKLLASISFLVLPLDKQYDIILGIIYADF